MQASIVRSGMGIDRVNGLPRNIPAVEDVVRRLLNDSVALRIAAQHTSNVHAAIAADTIDAIASDLRRG